MAKWGRTFFHKFREKVKHHKAVIEDLKDREDDDGIQLYFEEKEKLHDVLQHEELFWKQRAKAFWLKEGDTNSKYFHAVTSSKKKANHISALRSENGEWVSNHEELCQLLKNYYTGVFADMEATENFPHLEGGSSITLEQNNMLTANLTFTEFTEAVKSMHPDKASGPDGLNPAFFFSSSGVFLVMRSFSAVLTG